VAHRGPRPASPVRSSPCGGSWSLPDPAISSPASQSLIASDRMGVVIRPAALDHGGRLEDLRGSPDEALVLSADSLGGLGSPESLGGPWIGGHRVAALPGSWSDCPSLGSVGGVVLPFLIALVAIYGHSVGFLADSVGG